MLHSESQAGSEAPGHTLSVSPTMWPRPGEPTSPSGPLGDRAKTAGTLAAGPAQSLSFADRVKVAKSKPAPTASALPKGPRVLKGPKNLDSEAKDRERQNQEKRYEDTFTTALIPVTTNQHSFQLPPFRRLARGGRQERGQG